MDQTYELLKNASNEELQPIVDYILKASVSEQLSKTENFKKYSPNHARYVDEVFHELRLFGGNTLVSAHPETNNYMIFWKKYWE